MLNSIHGHKFLIAEVYQKEEKVNSIFQVVGGMQQKNKTETLACARNNRSNLRN